MKELFNEIKQYLTPCNLVIMAVTVIVFIAQTVCEFRGVDITTDYALAWWMVFDEHEYFRLFTHMFLHGSLGHLFNNMLVLAFVGSTLERTIGSFRYLVNYICSGFIAGLISAAYNRWCFKSMSLAESVVGGGYVYSLGASGAVFGTAGALLWIIIANRGHAEGISVRQILLFIILSVYAGIAGTGIDNAAHIAGVVFGTVSGMILYRSVRGRIRY